MDFVINIEGKKRSNKYRFQMLLLFLLQETVTRLMEDGNNVGLIYKGIAMAFTDTFL